MSIEEHVRAVRARIDAAARAAGRDPGEITLCAATKVQTSDAIRQVIAAGVPVCGENRVQEMTAHLADDAYAGARLHFIGHLQTNKVRQVVGKADLIQSVDSLHLLRAIEGQADKLGIIQDILLEVNIAGEASKGGFPPEEVLSAALQAAALDHVRLRGLMAIPPPVDAPEKNRPFFAAMRQLFVDIRREIDDNVSDIDCLSMGMSDDFEEAVAQGATLVRVGTALFGPRPPRTNAIE